VAIGKLRLGQLDRGAMVYLNEAALERVFMQDLATENAGGRREYRPKSAKKVTPPAKRLKIQK